MRQVRKSGFRARSLLAAAGGWLLVGGMAGCDDALPPTLPDTVVAAVRVTPATASVDVGDSLQLQATPLNAGGTELSGLTASWASDDTDVATVTDAGLVRGVSPGQTTIRAMIEQVVGASNLTVNDTTGDDTTTAEPDINETFASYENTAALLSNSALYFQTFGSQFIVLDTTIGFPPSTKSMRYDYPDRTSDGDRCSSLVISRLMDLTTTDVPSGGKEAWVEIYVRFETSFTTVAPSEWACASNPDLKLLLVGGAGEGRYEILWMNGGTRWVMDYPGGGPTGQVEVPISQAGMDWRDEEWHQLRMHMKNSATSSSADGAFEVWLDGVQVVDKSGINTTAPDGSEFVDISLMAIAANINQGPGAPQSLWWGAIRIFWSDPGW